MQAAKLDKSKRDALTDDDFAVPSKRKLPMHDERHVKLAWDMVERTHGLTPAERAEARRRILRKAKDLGVDTADWHKVRAMRLEAMALNISNGDDHPNKLPFSGVLTRIDEPSDEPPTGSNGQRVTITRAAAEKALESLLGMAVDYQPAFDGHDPQAKIGIITAANIVGTAIEIEGFIYAADFPEVAKRIQADKDVLGFSFEAQRIYVADPGSDPVEIVDCVFTGAAILRKDKAAYHSTSLAANADKEFDMDPEELKAMLDAALAAALAPVNARFDKLEAEAAKRIEANAATISKVEPHATALESCAAAMEADGVGLDPTRGHVAVLRRMASGMRAEAAVGKIPHIWRDHDYPSWASADPHKKEEDDMNAKEFQAALEAAMKPLVEKIDAQEKTIADLKASTETKIADLKASARASTPAPERKTVSPAISSLLAKAGISVEGEGDKKLAIAEVDKALAAANLTSIQRIQVKTELNRAGALA